jgi:hypothetical protein
VEVNYFAEEYVADKKQRSAFSLLHDGFLHSFLYNPDEGGDTFLRYVG